MKFIIEHLENEMYPWCLLEYKQICSYVGKENFLLTKIPSKDVKKVSQLAIVHTQSVLDLNFKKMCLLDPKAKEILTPSDNKKFSYFLFGGILGDYPEQGRTEKYLTSHLKNVETRNLGNKQMSTDSAVLVAKMILDGTPFEKITFVDEPEIELKKGKITESIILPYRYVVKNGKPLFNKKLITYLKEKESI